MRIHQRLKSNINKMLQKSERRNYVQMSEDKNDSRFLILKVQGRR